MSNTLLTISMITREALRVLENNLTFTKGVNRQYDDSFAVSGAKIGDTLNIRKPPRYTGRSGAALSIENSTESSVALALDTQFGVDMQFSSKDMALSIDDFSSRFITPAAATIANKIDRDGLALYKQVWNSTGTPGTLPTTMETFLKANALLADNGCPMDENISAVISPWTEASMIHGMAGYFNSVKEVGRQYEEGTMGRAGGMKFSMDQNVYNHSFAAFTLGSPIVAATIASGASQVTTSGWTSAAFAVGDVFTVADVYAVNPQTRESTGKLQQFVVTAISGTAATAPTIDFLPAIVTSGPFQNVTRTMTQNDVITVYNGATAHTSPQNMVYHRDAFTLACADLPLPGGVDMAARVASKKLGISMRMVRAYDIVNDVFPCRLEVLYGWKAIYPELAVRVHG